MSGDLQREDSTLVKDIAQQLNLYDNLFPEVESKELQVLFALIRIYLARCDNPALKREHVMVNSALMNRLALSYFDPFVTPTKHGLKEALISRLNSIRKYRISNTEVVRRSLVTCFYEQEQGIRRKQKVYLDSFMKNAGESFTKIATRLGVSPQAVAHAYKSLQRSEAKFWGYINYPMFKLRHFIAFFTLTREFMASGEPLRKLLFNNMPFTLSLNTDIYQGNSWASFVIPNQTKELHEFKQSLTELKGEVFRDFRISEFKSISTGSNLEFFDGKRWFFDPQLWTYGFFEFVRENKEILRKASQFHYSTGPIRFDRVDFLIAAILAADPLGSHCSIAKQLSQFGINASRPTVTRRIQRLLGSTEQSKVSDDESRPAIYPYLTYSGLGLSNLSMYLIECDEQYGEEMLYAVSYLPYYFLYGTDNGMLLSIKSTADDVAKFNYMIKGLNQIRVVAYSNRFENMGIRGLSPLIEKWDETKQKWLCKEGELDFVKRLESMP